MTGRDGGIAAEKNSIAKRGAPPYLTIGADGGIAADADIMSNGAGEKGNKITDDGVYGNDGVRIDNDAIAQSAVIGNVRGRMNYRGKTSTASLQLGYNASLDRGIGNTDDKIFIVRGLPVPDGAEKRKPTIGTGERVSIGIVNKAVDSPFLGKLIDVRYPLSDLASQPTCADDGDGFFYRGLCVQAVHLPTQIKEGKSAPSDILIILTEGILKVKESGRWTMIVKRWKIA